MNIVSLLTSVWTKARVIDYPQPQWNHRSKTEKLVRNPPPIEAHQQTNKQTNEQTNKCAIVFSSKTNVYQPDTTYPTPHPLPQ